MHRQSIPSGRLIAAAVFLSAALGCTGERSTPQIDRTVGASPAESPVALRIVAEARASFVARARPELAAQIPGLPRAVVALPASAASGFTIAADGLVPVLRSQRTRAPRIHVPIHASDALVLRDGRSPLGVRAMLAGAADVEAEVSDGYVVYPQALGGGDVILRVRENGVEDYVRFASPPAAPEIRYAVELGDHVAGLRLVGNTILFLDGEGRGRLRVAPPYLVDAEGQGRPATLGIEGCAYETRSRRASGRGILPPGSRTCDVTVRWADHGLAYPILVDPSWSAADSMGTPRWAHGAARLLDGRVMVAGGVTTSFTVTASAEIYDPDFDDWEPMDDMDEPRALFGIVRYGSGSNQYVLTAGGLDDSLGTLDTAERFRISTELWSSAGTMTTPRQDFSLAQVGGSTDIIAPGGYDGSTVSADVDLYAPSGPSWSSTASMNTARRGGGVAAMSSTNNGNNRVLVAGGIDAQGDIVAATEWYTPGMSPTWTATTGDEMFAPRYGHTMTLMAGNHVLVVGGWVDTNDCIRRAERFNPSSDDWVTADTVPGSLGICFHAAARLPNDGFVLVMGGLDAPTGSALDEAFLYDPIGDDWTSAGTLTDARWRHTATPAGFDDDVLVAGGHATPLASCELFTP